MSNNKEKQSNNKRRAEYIIKLDREKVKKETNKNRKDINIVELCEKFCNKYQDKDLKSYTAKTLKEICDDGNGLLDMYFITEAKVQKNKDIIIRLQYIITSANYILNIKEIESLKQNTMKMKNKIDKTMHRAKKLEDESKIRAKEVRHVKNDIKGIITTILAVTLTFSIIPTAMSAMQNIDTNYILPFMATIVVFGILMIFFIYTIYQDKIKWINWVMFIVSILICILLWINVFCGFINIKNNSVEYIQQENEDKLSKKN